MRLINVLRPNLGSTLRSNNSKTLLSKASSSVELPPVATNYAALLDGDTQKWALSVPVAVTALSVITFKFIANAYTVANTYRRFFGSENFSLSLDTGADKNKFRFTGCSVKLDGVQISSGNTSIPQDGLEHEITIIPSVNVTIEAFGGLLGRSDRNVSAILFDLRFDGVIYLPLNKRSEGALQTPDLGSVSASMVDYDASVWVEV